LRAYVRCRRRLADALGVNAALLIFHEAKEGKRRG
jgi:hypothetical protein